MTVNQFLAIANSALGGASTGYSFSDINEAATAINESFDNGTVNNGYLGCDAPKASLGDKVWEDTDKDGIQDSGENGIANVTVKLYTCADVLVATTTTNANGIYSFTNLTPGDYYVKFITPAGYTVTTKDAGSDNSKDSDIDASTGKTICTTLIAGENDLTWDAGFFVTPPPQTASIGDKVWEDSNHNGIQDSGENGIANVTVKLYTCANVLVATTTTNANGIYSFTNLNPADYYVAFTAPSGMAASPKDQGSNNATDSDADVTTGKTVCTTLSAGENDLTWDAGFYAECKNKIGDTVWHDKNVNGVQDGGEPGISGVEIKLYNSTGTLIATDVTDVNGKYLFENLPNGTYEVKISSVNFIATGVLFSTAQLKWYQSTTSQDCGSVDEDDDNDNDGIKNCTDDDDDNDGIKDDHDNDDDNDGKSDTEDCDDDNDGTHDDDEIDNDSDCDNDGIGNHSDDDDDNDGVKDDNDNDDDNDGVNDDNDEDDDNDGVKDDEHSNDNDENENDSDNQGNDSGCLTRIVVLNCNDNLNIDFGFYKTCVTLTKTADKQTANPGEVITYTLTTTNCGDIELHGGVDLVDQMLGINMNFVLAPGATKVVTKSYTVKATDCGNLVNNASAVGHPVDGSANVTSNATFTVIINCKSSLGDKVWEDTDKDGIQDNGENGIPNVTVNLYTCADVLVATTTTNANGEYLFNNLTPGDYYVVFVKPNGMIFTSQNSGSDDAKDSDVDITNGRTICTTLIAGENDLTWDAGLHNAASTCDLTKFTTYTQGGWGSPSNSGPGTIRDAYFSAVYPSGLTVGGTFTLKLTSAQAVEDYLPDGGTPAALTQNYINPTTAINVLAGQVVAMQLNVDYSAAGYLGATSYNLGSLNILSGPFSGMTVNQFLAIANSALGGANTGYSLSDINAAATAINENFDNGTVNNGYLGCDEPKASLGDKVWEDTNHNGIKDSGENGIANVTVKLYTCSDVLVATTTTNANGIYSFTNLNPGDYYVVFTTPSGMSASPNDQGSNDAADSDADVTTGKTICTTLTAGENDLTWDAGFYTPVVEEEADLKIEKTSNVTNANCGDNVTYTIKVTNQGPNTAANVSVNDILPASLLYQSATVSQGSFNSTSGLWTVGTLANGAVATLTLTVKIDCGTINSTVFDLGAAEGFNLFVLEDLNQPSSDTEGKVAVGHNAT